jgi:CRISPR-associated protein Cas2
VWVLVFFDLPTETRKERRMATEFRKNLLKDGFQMFQFSIYLRFCMSNESADVHTNRTKSNLPEHGKVAILRITDRQFGMIQLFHGLKNADLPQISQQLELF